MSTTTTCLLLGLQQGHSTDVGIGQLLDATLVTSTSGSTTQPGPQPPVEVVVSSMALSPERIGSATTTREQTNTTKDSHLTLVRGSELR